MPRFFTQDIQGDLARIQGADAAHIAGSLRMGPGGELIVCDLEGSDYLCRILTASPDLVELAVLERWPCQSEPRVDIRLFQALPKGDKLETIVQKATELGAAEIVPVLTGRCISRPDPKAMEKKRAKLERTALEAAKQSGRGRIPAIGPLLPLEAAVRAMKESELALFFYENAQTPLRARLDPKATSISLLVGSEGGFSPEEADLARREGLLEASLGPRILRCETAPVCAISAILYAMGEF